MGVRVCFGVVIIVVSVRRRVWLNRICVRLRVRVRWHGLRIVIRWRRLRVKLVWVRKLLFVNRIRLVNVGSSFLL